jgi:hypothetical protein
MAYQRAWHRRNPEASKAYGRAAYARLTPEQKAHKAAIQRRNYLRRKYNLTEAQVDALKEAQGDNCAICGREKPNARWRRELVIDHCHTTGAVRGLLCNRCNTHLGWYEEHLDKIKGYLDDDTK